MLRPSPNHRTLRLPNDDDDEIESALSPLCLSYVIIVFFHGTSRVTGS